MAVWVVRQSEPKWAAWDKIALENGVVVIDFGLETDISRSPGTVYKPSYVDADAHVREVLQKHRNAGSP